MQKSKIEWTDYTINPIKGKCPMACPYCYARRMYDRYKWNPALRYDPSVFMTLPNKSSRVFVGSTFELFHPLVSDNWMKEILSLCRRTPEHTFIFLTKQPQNLIKWSPFPDNCWIGVSTTGFDCRSGLENTFANIKAKVNFVSIEPLLDYTPMDFRWVDWIIIGQQTPISAKTTPKVEWIREIVEAADKAGKPVFLKNNLWDLLYSQAWDNDIFWANDKAKLRQEFPSEAKAK